MNNTCPVNPLDGSISTLGPYFSRPSSDRPVYSLTTGLLLDPWSFARASATAAAIRSAWVMIYSPLRVYTERVTGLRERSRASPCRHTAPLTP